MFLFVAFIIVFLFNYRSIKDYISQFFIWSFVCIWGLQIILSQTGYLGLIIPKTQTIFLVSLHLFAFYFGFIQIKISASNSLQFKTSGIYILEERILSLINSRAFKIFFFILLLYISSITLRFYRELMITQSLGLLRTEYYEGMLGARYTIINKYLLVPTGNFFMFLFGYLTIKKRNLLWFLIGAYLCMLSFIGGGRGKYVIIFISCIFSWVILSNSFKTSNTRYKKYVPLFIVSILGIIFYVVIVLTTAARYNSIGFDKENYSSHKELTNNSFYSYFVGPICALDYSLNHNFPDKIGGYKYGTLSFAEFEETFNKFMGKLGNGYKRPFYDYTEFVQDKEIDIGDGGGWNALYTWCNCFYCDLGILGFVVFPFFWGIMIRKVIAFFMIRKDIISSYLLITSFFLLLFSYSNYSMSNSYLIILIYLFLYIQKGMQKQQILRFLSKDIV